MIKKFLKCLGLGMLALFVFSLPVGREKKLFDVMHFYIVDTKPVHWAIKMIGLGVTTTTDTAKKTADDIVNRVDSKFTQASDTFHQAQ